MSLCQFARISGHLLIDRLLIDWLLLILTFARNDLWLYWSDIRSEWRAGFRWFIARGWIANLLLAGPQLRLRLFLFGYLIELMRQQSGTLHAFVLCWGVLDGQTLGLLHLSMVDDFVFYWPLKSLLFSWRFLYFLFGLCKSIVYVYFYFDLSVSWAIRLLSFTLNRFIVEI